MRETQKTCGAPAAGYRFRKQPRTREQGNVRPVTLAVVCFLLGAAASAVWFYRASTRDPGSASASATASQSATALSKTTRDVLRHLDSPVEVRFYSLLTPGSVPDSVGEFAGRVDQLLAEFQREANGRIKVIRNVTQSDSAADTASADGIKPFNLDKGAACFLGLTVAGQSQKESLALLSPDWEPALEFDLARAIVRVTAVKTAATLLASVPAFDAATTEEVRRALPNLSAVSLEEGTRVLRQTALAEFAAAASEMESQVKEAQQRLSEAQRGRSESEQQAAMKHLQQVQAEQAEKLKAIAARAQARIAALESLKK